MNIYWMNLENSDLNKSVAESLNKNDKYVICDLSLEASKGRPSVSYFTFCSRELMKTFKTTNEINKDLIIIDLNLSNGEMKEFEMLYLIFLLLPLDPIVIGNVPTFHKIFHKFFSNVIDFKPNVEFVVDLESKISKFRKSEISEQLMKVINIFNSYGMILSPGTRFEKIIKTKDNSGPIRYDEFLDILERTEFVDLSKTAFVREHDPVDLFVSKYLKS